MSPNKESNIQIADTEPKLSTAGVSASASKAAAREKPVSPVVLAQPQLHSYRSNSEVVQKKSRKQGAAGALAGKNKKLAP